MATTRLSSDAVLAEAVQTRQSVVSAASLMMVALLKLNRALVPVLLRYVRGRRENWIHRSARDVHNDLLNGKNCILCVASCCLSTYKTDTSVTAASMRGQSRDVQYDDSSDSDSDSDDGKPSADLNNNAQRPIAIISPKVSTSINSVPSNLVSQDPAKVGLSSASVVIPLTGKDYPGATERTPLIIKRSSQNVEEEVEQDPVQKLTTLQSGVRGTKSVTKRKVRTYTNTDIDTDEGLNIHPHMRRIVHRSLGHYGDPNQLYGMTVSERYYRLLVAQEENHRRMKDIPCMYESVMYAWVTVFSLIIYGWIVIHTVVQYFPLTPQECLTFSFSLVTTAAVSEADKLLKVMKRRKPARNYTGSQTSGSQQQPIIVMQGEQKQKPPSNETELQQGNQFSQNV